MDMTRMFFAAFTASVGSIELVMTKDLRLEFAILATAPPEAHHG